MSDKIDELLKRKAALEARISRLKEREASDERKVRTRVHVLLGAAFASQLKHESKPLEIVRKLITQHLKPRDQAVVLDYMFPSIEAASANEQS